MGEALRTQKAILKYTKGKQAEEEETFFYLGLKYEHVRDLLNKSGGDLLEAILKEAKEIVREEKRFLPGLSPPGGCLPKDGEMEGGRKRLGKRIQAIPVDHFSPSSRRPLSGAGGSQYASPNLSEGHEDLSRQ